MKRVGGVVYGKKGGGVKTSKKRKVQKKVEVSRKKGRGDDEETRGLTKEQKMTMKSMPSGAFA